MRSCGGLTSDGGPGVRRWERSDKLLSGIPKRRGESGLLSILKRGQSEYGLAGKSLECVITSSEQWNAWASGRRVSLSRRGVLLGRNVCKA